MLKFKVVHKKTFKRTVLRQSRAIFCRNLRNYDLPINDMIARICNLRTGILRKLLICNSGMSTRICGFADFVQYYENFLRGQRVCIPYFTI
jgi:hypothetical protein